MELLQHALQYAVIVLDYLAKFVIMGINLDVLLIAVQILVINVQEELALPQIARQRVGI